MEKNFKYKIYAFSEERLNEWQGNNFEKLQYTRNLQECLEQPYKIIIVDAFCDDPLYQHAFLPEFVNFDWTTVDLVLIKEVLWETVENIKLKFIEKNKIKNYLISSHDWLDRNDKNLFNPYWFLRIVNYGDIKTTVFNNKKKYLFEALLGCPRENRLYVFSKILKNKNMLDNSILTFRNCFLFEWETLEFFLKSTDERIKKIFNDVKAFYPYVSPSMDKSWENVTENELTRRYFLDGIDIPWKVYENTWYSILTETNDISFNITDISKVSEKTAKLFLAKRVFVMFGCYQNLKLLHNLGFKTFDCIIDESYDNETDHFIRFEKAFQQVELLTTLDPEDVYNKTETIREHNFNRMIELRDELRNHANATMLKFVPNKFC
jgi:hypothetical protein